MIRIHMHNADNCTWNAKNRKLVFVSCRYANFSPSYSVLKIRCAHCIKDWACMWARDLLRRLRNCVTQRSADQLMRSNTCFPPTSTCFSYSALPLDRDTGRYNHQYLCAAKSQRDGTNIVGKLRFQRLCDSCTISYLGWLVCEISSIDCKKRIHFVPKIVCRVWERNHHTFGWWYLGSGRS